METNKGKDKEKYSKINISDDEDDFESKSFISRTLEIPKIILEKPLKKLFKKEDYFDKAIRYNPDPLSGLNSLQVDERMVHNLTNKQTKKLSKSIFRIIVDNVFTFFNILLTFIAICLILVGDIKDCFFMVIVSANTAIGIFQEIKAKKAVDKLSLLNVPEVKVRRDGLKMMIPTDKMVLDEIFYLSAGDEIPADSYIVHGEIEVNESSLTGESLPIKKVVDDYVLAGSFVVSGSCMCRCDRIGEHNYIAQLQNKARKVKKVKSILLTSLNKIIKIVSAIVIPVGIAIGFSIYASLTGEDMFEKMSTVIMQTGGQIVSMIPSGLFLLISTALAVSVINLSKQKTMVQDSYAIESLARSNVLCLDKTGTLTDGTMQVEKMIKLVNEDLEIENIIGTYVGVFEDKNVTSVALSKKYPNKNSYEVEIILPFSSSRKLSAVQFKDIGTYVLGAPEFLTTNSELLLQSEKYAEQGYRVLLLGRTKQKLKDDIVFKKIEAIAFFVLSDHIREEAYDTIKWFKENDVDIKIISGDNPLTVSKIAEKVGVNNAQKYISLEGLNNDEVAQLANEYVVFGRVSPEQKAVLIKSLKNAGKTVAMTGDGVNDILAMKQANCAIAMASGSEAARNSSHLVLMDSNFACMPEVVKEGRRVINNIQRSASLFLMKTIFSIIFAALGLLSIFIPIDLHYPFSPGHLYVLEFFVIGIPATILALQPNHELVSGSFLKNVILKSLPSGLCLLTSTLFFVISQYFGWFGIETKEVMLTMACLSVSLTGLCVLFSVCWPFNKVSAILYVVMLLASLVWLFVVPTELNSLYISQLDIYDLLLVCLVVLVMAITILLINVITRTKNKKYENVK